MAVVVSMPIVKTNHTAVIVRVKLVIDVSEIIAGNISPFVLPDFTPQLSISPFIGDFMSFISDLLFSHDLQYPRCVSSSSGNNKMKKGVCYAPLHFCICHPYGRNVTGN